MRKKAQLSIIIIPLGLLVYLLYLPMPKQSPHQKGESSTEPKAHDAINNNSNADTNTNKKTLPPRRGTMEVRNSNTELENHEVARDSAGQSTKSAFSHPDHQRIRTSITPTPNIDVDKSELVKKYKDEYRLFFDSKSTDADVQAKLINSAVDLALDDQDIVETGHRQGVSFEQIAKLRADRISEFRQEAIALLGPDQGQIFFEYAGATAYVPIAQDFANRCAEQGYPLRDSAMIPVAIDLTRHLDLINTATSADQANAATGLALNEVKASLTPEQLRIFSQLLAEHPKPKH